MPSEMKMPEKHLRTPCPPTPMILAHLRKLHGDTVRSVRQESREGAPCLVFVVEGDRSAVRSTLSEARYIFRTHLEKEDEIVTLPFKRKLLKVPYGSLITIPEDYKPKGRVSKVVPVKGTSPSITRNNVLEPGKTYQILRREHPKDGFLVVMEISSSWFLDERSKEDKADEANKQGLGSLLSFEEMYWMYSHLLSPGVMQ